MTCVGCKGYPWQGLWDVQRKKLLHERVTWDGKYEVISCTNPEKMNMPEELYRSLMGLDKKPEPPKPVLKGYIVPVRYTGGANFYVEAVSLEEAQEKAREAFSNGRDEIPTGSEWEELSSVGTPEEVPPRGSS